MKFRRLPLLLILATAPVVSLQADISGFGNTGVGYTLTQGQNGAGPSVSNNVATLTTKAQGESNSLFYNTRQNVSAFTATFTYQNTTPATPTADGVTFTIQNDPRGLSAVGGGGGSLGYAGTSTSTPNPGIIPSVAVGFNIYNAGSGTGLGLSGGLTLTNTSAANLGSGRFINVSLSYNGTTLTETLTDPSNGNTSTFAYNVSIPNTVGSNLAYVGFTGATGADTSNQQISNFTFTSTAVPEPSTWTLSGLGLFAGVVIWRRRFCREATTVR